MRIEFQKDCDNDTRVKFRQKKMCCAIKSMSPLCDYPDQRSIASCHEKSNTVCDAQHQVGGEEELFVHAVLVFSHCCIMRAEREFLVSFIFWSHMNLRISIFYYVYHTVRPHFILLTTLHSKMLTVHATHLTWILDNQTILLLSGKYS